VIWFSGLTAVAKRRFLRDLDRSLKRLRAEANELELVRAELDAIDEACASAIWSIEDAIATLKIATIRPTKKKKRRSL
jgi:hypothetical protein